MDITKFSVAMCVYEKDNPEWFKMAIESILSQTVKPSEIVLVVDGPLTEELDLIVENLSSNEIFKIIRFPKNRGHGEARRAGFEACSNELIAIMDADDICVPTRFEKQLKCFENNIDIVGGNIAEFIDGVNNVVGYRLVPQNDADIKQYLKKRCPFNQVTVMLRKSVYLQAGGYIDWYWDEDYYLWIRMLQKGAIFMNVDEVLVNVRVGKEMYQRRGGIKYFKSEKKLQKYMLKNKIIGIPTYIINVLKRFIVQVLLPNKLRGWVFKKFARNKNEFKKI